MCLVLRAERLFQKGGAPLGAFQALVLVDFLSERTQKLKSAH